MTFAIDGKERTTTIIAEMLSLNNSLAYQFLIRLKTDLVLERSGWRLSMEKKTKDKNIYWTLHRKPLRP